MVYTSPIMSVMNLELFNIIDHIELGMLFWSDNERQMLVELVQRYQSPNKLIRWKEIAQFFPNRTTTQLRTYYTQVLKTEKSHAYNSWTSEQTYILIICVEVYGRKWNLIQQHYFPTISVNGIRMRYHKLYHIVSSVKQVLN